MFLEPRDGISRLETVERAQEIFHATWVGLHEFARVVAIVGDVATPATGDADLGENLGAALKNKDVPDTRFPGRDRPKEPGCSSSDDNEIVVFVLRRHRV